MKKWDFPSCVLELGHLLIEGQENGRSCGKIRLYKEVTEVRGIRKAYK